MSFILAVVLGLLALAFVLYPLYKRNAWQEQQSEEVLADALSASASVAQADPVEQEETARAAIREVEFDYQLGNIEDQDYQALRERYMQRALVALRSRYEREQEIDDEIEEQLRRLKETHEKTDS